jgi:hypothetical protein
MAYFAKGVPGWNHFTTDCRASGCRPTSTERAIESVGIAQHSIGVDRYQEGIIHSLTTVLRIINSVNSLNRLDQRYLL